MGFALFQLLGPLSPSSDNIFHRGLFYTNIWSILSLVEKRFFGGTCIRAHLEILLLLLGHADRPLRDPRPPCMATGLRSVPPGFSKSGKRPRLEQIGSVAETTNKQTVILISYRKLRLGRSCPPIPISIKHNGLSGEKQRKNRRINLTLSSLEVFFKTVLCWGLAA